MSAATRTMTSTATSTAPPRTYTTSIAHTPGQIRAAQRLRHRVFVGELGARPSSSDAHDPGLEADDLDRYCDHLLITETSTGEAVGTYRLLPPGRGDTLYSAGEFDLTALRPLRDATVEAGRSCVHPDHRNGTVITLMWAALARYTLLSGHRYLAGCASVPLSDGGTSAADTWRLVRQRYLAPKPWRVRPHRPWPVEQVSDEGPVSHNGVPPLLRGYLRLGAWVCGPPAHDPEFDVADFFVLLPLDRIDDRYLRRFLGEDRR